jgi:hypothetical protein
MYTAPGTLLIPIEYYECLAGQREFARADFSLRLETELNRQEWDQMTAVWDLQKHIADRKKEPLRKFIESRQRLIELLAKDLGLEF